MNSSLPWSCKPFGDKTTPEHYTNIVSEKDEVIIAKNVMKDDAEFIVSAVNYRYERNKAIARDNKMFKWFFSIFFGLLILKIIWDTLK